MFTEYSLWYLPLLVLVACVASVLQYYPQLISFAIKKQRVIKIKQSNFLLKQSFFSKKQRVILASLRALSIFLLLFLFLSPVKHIKHKEIEKPTIVLAQDNSQSLALNKYSPYYKNKYLKDLDKLANDLQEDYNVVRLTFGSKTSLLKEKDESFSNKVRYNDFSTDISQMFNYINENYSSENLSGVVLASDGIVTFGDNPLNLTDNFSCPIYTVAMGDTTKKKDLSITDVQFNKITFVDDEYPLEITLNAIKAKNNSATLSMIKDGRTTLLKHFSINEDDFSLTVPTKAISHKAGIEKISFLVSYLDNESNKANNRKDIYVEVLNSKKKIMIVAPAPHPDLSTLKTIINNNKNYTCDVSLNSNIKGNVNDYSMVIFHNMPKSSNDVNTIKQVMSKGIPCLFVVGQGVNLSLFNTLQLGLNISSFSSSINQTLALYNKNFSMFTLTPNAENIMKNLPPLLSPLGKYNASSSLQTFLYQKIGSVSTSYPLICFNETPNNKIGMIMGENIWRWRLENYLINQTNNEVDEIIGKTIQDVSTKTNRNRFRIEHKDLYNQNEPVVFQAELYNDNYELVNNVDVDLKITSKTTSSHYIFGKTSNAYYLNLGALSQGEYTYVATTKLGNKAYTEKGSFVVNSTNLEAENLVANHTDLFTIASKTNAKMLMPQNVLALEKLIKDNQNIKPIIHQTITNKKFISLWWYWLLITLSIGSEWFLRKYWGRI